MRVTSGSRPGLGPGLYDYGGGVRSTERATADNNNYTARYSPLLTSEECYTVESHIIMLC